MLNDEQKLEIKEAIPHLRRVLTGLTDVQIEFLQTRIEGHLKRRIAKRNNVGPAQSKSVYSQKVTLDAQQKLEDKMRLADIWSRDNLTVGMVVRVRTSAPNKVRIVTSVGDGVGLDRQPFYGEHMILGDEGYGVGTKTSLHYGDIILNVMCHDGDPSNPVTVDLGYEKPTALLPVDQSDWKLVTISKFLDNVKARELA